MNSKTKLTYAQALLKPIPPPPPLKVIFFPIEIWIIIKEYLLITEKCRKKKLIEEVEQHLSSEFFSDKKFYNCDINWMKKQFEYRFKKKKEKYIDFHYGFDIYYTIKTILDHQSMIMDDLFYNDDFIFSLDRWATSRINFRKNPDNTYTGRYSIKIKEDNKEKFYIISSDNKKTLGQLLVYKTIKYYK